MKIPFHRGDAETQERYISLSFGSVVRAFLRASASLRFILLLMVLGIVGCVPLRYGGAGGGDNGNGGGDHQALVEKGPTASPDEAIGNARKYLKDKPNWEIDCSHFVLACYHSATMDRFFAKFGYLGHNLTKDLRIYLEQHGKRRAHAADIRPGDILIFNKTYDKNRDGHIDEKDTDTHCALVAGFQDMVVTYIDASESRKPPRLHERKFSFYDKGPNEHVAVDQATGRRIRARETFYAAYEMPKD